MREWAVLAGKGRLLLSGSVVLASLKAPVNGFRPSDIAKEMTFTGSGFNEIDYAINDYETGLRILYVRLVC